jgi:hypothetical protein
MYVLNMIAAYATLIFYILQETGTRVVKDFKEPEVLESV